VISPSQSMRSSNVPIWFTSIHSHPYIPIMMVFIAPFPSSSTISSVTAHSSYTSSSSHSDTDMYTYSIEILTGSASNKYKHFIKIIFPVLCVCCNRHSGKSCYITRSWNQARPLPWKQIQRFVTRWQWQLSLSQLITLPCSIPCPQFRS
jgi:hypothetical protein